MRLQLEQRCEKMLCQKTSLQGIVPRLIMPSNCGCGPLLLQQLWSPSASKIEVPHSAPMPKFWFLGNPARELIQTKCKLSEI